MTRKKYDKYIIKSPKVVKLAYHPTENVRGVTFPDEVYMDEELIAGCPAVVDVGWVFEIPDPDPVERTHSHPFDEFLCFIGTDPNNPHDLGAEFEIQIGDEKHRIDTTSAIFVPEGVAHCPMKHIRVDRPFLRVVIALNQRYPAAAEEMSEST